MSDSIYCYQSVSLSPSSQSLPSSSKHCNGYPALLKALPSHFWWDALPWCYNPNWL